MTLKPSLEKVQKDLQYFDYELQMYCYHKLNGRDEEAQSYLDTYNSVQEALANELIPESQIEKLKAEEESEINQYTQESIEEETLVYKPMPKKQVDLYFSN